MTFLPIAALPAPAKAKATATELEPTSASGDFAALLALMAGVMPAPVPVQDQAAETTDPPASGAQSLPSVAEPVLPTADDSAAPFADSDGPGPGTSPHPFAPLATVLPGAPLRKAPSAAPSPIQVPASPVAVEHSPVLVPPSGASSPLPPSAPAPAPVAAAPRTSRHEASTAPQVKPEIHIDEAPLSPTEVDPVVVLERPKPDIPLPEKVAGLPAPKVAAAPAAPTLPNFTAPLAAPPRADTPVAPDAPPPTPMAPPPVSEQIVSAVVPLHGRGDGRHEVTLELRPEELGTIRVEVSVEHQTVHLTLHAAEPATSRLLSAALPELRSALVDAGLTPGHVGVGADGGSAGARHPSTEGEAPVRRRLRNRPAGQTERNATVPTVRPAPAGRLDLFL